MRCNHTDGMPRGDFNIYFASSRRGYVRAEEYVYLFYFKFKDVKEAKNTSSTLVVGLQHYIFIMKISEKITVLIYLVLHKYNSYNDKKIKGLKTEVLYFNLYFDFTR